MEQMRTAWNSTSLALGLLLVGCPSGGSGEDNGDTLVSATETTGDPTTTPSTSPSTSGAESGTTDEDESSSGTPVDACGAGRMCLGAPPLGWTGPVVIAKGDNAEALPQCRGAYPGNDFVRFEGFVQPEPAQCECSCELTSAGCYMYTYVTNEPEFAGHCYDIYGSPNSEGCYELPVPVQNGNLVVETYPIFAGGGGSSCDQQASETIPEIPWGAIVQGCTGDHGDEVCGVNNRVCYDRPPDGFEQQICYIAQGDVPCPPNTDYLQKTIRYSAVDDDRDCTSCQCGQLNYCIDEYEFFTSDDCSGQPAGTINNGTCMQGVTAASVMFDFSGITCPVLSKSEPEGEVKPLDPWTYCCSDPM